MEHGTCFGQHSVCTEPRHARVMAGVTAQGGNALARLPLEAWRQGEVPDLLDVIKAVDLLVRQVQALGH